MAVKEKCFACDRALGADFREVDTRDGQRVYVGPDCYEHVRNAGPEGYRPPKGGPRLWLTTAR